MKLFFYERLNIALGVISLISTVNRISRGECFLALLNMSLAISFIWRSRLQKRQRIKEEFFLKEGEFIEVEISSISNGFFGKLCFKLESNFEIKYFVELQTTKRKKLPDKERLNVIVLVEGKQLDPIKISFAKLEKSFFPIDE